MVVHFANVASHVIVLWILCNFIRVNPKPEVLGLRNSRSMVVVLMIVAIMMFVNVFALGSQPVTINKDLTGDMMVAAPFAIFLMAAGCFIMITAFCLRNSVEEVRAPMLIVGIACSQLIIGTVALMSLVGEW